MASPPAARAYRGLYTSLYQTLSPETITHIENAVWFKMTGDLTAARAIFANELQPLKDEPIVIIEHADLELESSRWGKAWRILDAALKNVLEKGEAGEADLNLPHYRLIKLT